jgi:hypothetical protein
MIPRVGRSRAVRGKRGSKRRQAKRKEPGFIFFIALYTPIVLLSARRGDNSPRTFPLISPIPQVSLFHYNTNIIDV